MRHEMASWQRARAPSCFRLRVLLLFKIGVSILTAIISAKATVRYRSTDQIVPIANSLRFFSFKILLTYMYIRRQVRRLNKTFVNGNARKFGWTRSVR